MQKRVYVYENELVSLIKRHMVEQESESGVAGGGVSDGTSDAGGTGAKTWESGVSRGPANPAGGGITHWADTYTISRGKANPLNESKWYNTFLDFVGIIDPTGIADGVNAISYFRQGDIIYAMLSLVSLVPYIGDAVAKPFVYLIKSGKVSTKGINAALKSGNAQKVASAFKNTKGGEKILKGMADPKTQSFLGGIASKMGKIPGLGKFSKDITKYGDLLKQATKVGPGASSTVRIFRKNSLLTRMQRKGLLNRTKLYSKFIGTITGIGGVESVKGMDENQLNNKFTEFLNTDEGMDSFNEMDLEDQKEMVDAMSN